MINVELADVIANGIANALADRITAFEAKVKSYSNGEVSVEDENGNIYQQVPLVGLSDCFPAIQTGDNLIVYGLDGGDLSALVAVKTQNVSELPEDTAGIKVRSGEKLYLGGQQSEIVGLMVELCTLLSGTVSAAGDNYNGQLTLIQTDLGIIKTKLEEYKP